MSRRAGSRARRYRGRRRLVAAVPGVAALVALAGLLIGVPMLLVALQANPLPDHLPSLHELIDRSRQALTGPDDGTVLLATVRTVAWGSWMVFAVSVAVEAVAAAAGRTVPAIRGLAGVQRPAAYLVAVIAATAASPAISAAAAPTPATQLGAQAAADGPAVPAGMGTGFGSPAGDGPFRPSPRTATPVPGSDRVGGVAGFGRLELTGPAGGPGWRSSARPSARGLPVAEVGRYDSLWRLAERHLGDGRRWTEIYRLNTARTQPDGGRLTDPDHVEPGWTLVLPADARGASRDGTGDAGTDPHRHKGNAVGAVVVHRGDTLSGLAARHLGTPGATQALFDANVGRIQPDGDRLTDPDLLRPGWRLTLPTRPATPEPRPAPGEPPPSSPRHPPPPTPAPGRSAPASPTPARPTPASSAPANSTASTSSPGSSPSGRSSSIPGPGGERADRSPGGWVQLPSGSILGLGLITVIAGLLELLRRRRRQHRIPGDPSTPSPDSEPFTPRPASGAAAAEDAWMTVRRQLAHPAEDTDDPDDEISASDGGDGGDGDLDGDDGDDDGYFAHPATATEADPADEPASRSRSPDPASRLRVSIPEPAPDTSGEGRWGDGMSAGRWVAGARGVSPGLFPAPSLLGLIGPPAAAPIARCAWAGGIGLIGPGATGAARAIAARLLTATGPMGAQLITTEAAVADLLPADAVEAFAATPGVTVFRTLREAVSGCESELLARARWLLDREDLAAHRDDPAAVPVPAVLLMAHAPADTPADAPLTAHTDAVLQLGAPRELGAVLLGRWPRATVTVAADGTVSQSPASRPHAQASGPTETQSGRAELLTAADAADLLADLLPPLRDALDLLDPTNLLPPLEPAGPPALPSRRAGSPRERASAVVAGVAVDGAGAGEVPSEGRPADGQVLEIAVFGRVRLLAARDGREVTGVRAKVRSLLALLAVHPDGLTSDQVGEALWPEAPPDRVPGRLSATLALTRRLLRDTVRAAAADETGTSPADDPTWVVEDAGADRLDLVPLVDGRYRLHPTVLASDYQRFTAALTAAGQARRAGDDAAHRAALRVVAELYRSSHGEVLGGIDYSWATPVRERLRRQATDALATLATLLTPSATNNPTTDGDRARSDGADSDNPPVGQRPRLHTGPDQDTARASRPASPTEAAVDTGPAGAEQPEASEEAAADEDDPVATGDVVATADVATRADLVTAAETLEALEAAIDVDPYNEELYRQVMRLHAAAGRREDVYQTLRLLEARLLDIDTEPEATTSALVKQLLSSRSGPVRGRQRDRTGPTRTGPTLTGPTRRAPDPPTADRAPGRKGQ